MKFCILRNFLLILSITLYLENVHSTPYDKLRNDDDESQTYPDLPIEQSIESSSYTGYSTYNGNYMFCFDIDKEYKRKLINPNKIKNIVYNDSVLVFDENARLPKRPSCSTVCIHTCKHFNPTLVEVSGSLGYTFYSLDIKRGKWTNYEMSTLKAFEKNRRDEIKWYDYGHDDYYNGVMEMFAIFIIKESLELSKYMCKVHQCDESCKFKGAVLKINFDLTEDPPKPWWNRLLRKKETSKSRYTRIK